ncbi:MAG: ribonuclease H-like domain-containing protein [Pseudomonadales bacterium]|nr:ribonuclease H-like domain-containing protein [Candidatus Woesebacteria bacterium]MCB9801500.1 ribonuclease H-like domain-containing protein [Pseudomonadales bacterium]
MKQVIFDVETKRTFDEVGGVFPEKLGISYIGVCVREHHNTDGEVFGFFEKDIPDFLSLLESADVVVGFNSDHFDLPTLLAYNSDLNLREMPSLDLMARIKDSAGHRIGLDAVAKETLGVGKTGDGLDAIKYYQTKNWDALAKYCLQDVAVTRDIYDHGVGKGHVLFKNKWNRLITCPVDFSFTPVKKVGTQRSLF